jgi:hypothetical protein
MTSVAFPEAWWEVAEVAFATGSFQEDDYSKTLEKYREKMCPRKGPREQKRLKVRQFDTAVRGATLAMAGKPETVASTLKRSRWYIRNGIVPVFARPAGWDYREEELEVMAESREAGLEPVFLSYDKRGVDSIPGPDTGNVEVNPWKKWMT